MNGFNDYERYSTENFSNIKITAIENQETSYYAKPKYDLVQFLTDLGSLVGLYVGLSLIDLSIIFIDLIDKIKLFLHFLLNLNLIIKVKNILKLLFNRILQIVFWTKIINWTLLAKIITLPVMLSQIIYLVNDYLLYSTLIKVEFVDLTANLNSIDDIEHSSNLEYSWEEFPGITVCTENTFEEIYFDRKYPSYYYKDMVIIEDVENKLNSRLKYIMDHKNVLQNDDHYVENTERILNYTRHLKRWFRNSLIRNLIFGYIMTKEYTHLFKDFEFSFSTPDFNEYDFIFFNWIQPYMEYFTANDHDEFENNTKKYHDLHTFGWDSLRKVQKFLTGHTHSKGIYSFTQWVSSLGMCHKFFVYRSKKNLHNFKFSHDQIFQFPDYISRRYYIHDPNEFPMEKYEGQLITVKDESIPVKFLKIKFTELQFPYNTMCKYYNKAGRSECLNRCYMQRYIKIFKCIPTKNYLHALFRYKNYPSNEFCQYDLDITNDINNLIETHCKINCPSPCIHYRYQFDISPGNSPNRFSVSKPMVSFEFASNFYQHIINYPKLTMTNLMINIANVINLWHGSYYFMFIINMSNIYQKIFLKMKIKLHCRRYFIDNKKFLVSSDCYFENSFEIENG